jgi:glycosyltransferase involved in cell wall biosynthesis
MKSKAGQTLVVVSGTGGSGGPSRSLGTVLHQLDGRVHRTLIAPPGSLTKLAAENGWCEQHIRIPNSRRLHFVVRLVDIALITAWIVWNRRRIAAIHANGEAELSLVGLGAKLTGCRLIVCARSSVIRPWVRRVAPVWRRILPCATWVAVSDLTQKLVTDAGLVEESNCYVIPNAIDFGQVVACEKESKEPDEVVRIGYLGGKGSHKGFDLLPAVVSNMTEPVIWHVYTSPPKADAPDHEIKTWRELQSLEKSVKIFGRLTDVRQGYAQCDIVFSPSYNESFGRVPIEAMANGLPVVLSDIEAFRQFVGDEDEGEACGLTFAVGDAAHAADSLSRLAADPELRRRMGARGKLKASQYTPEPVAQAFWEAYGFDPSLGPMPGVGSRIR